MTLVARRATARAVLGGLALALACIALLPGAAQAEPVGSVLGIPCSTQANGVQACTGDIAHRVPSWDGVPLDVNVWLPPADRKGPFPLIVFHHGYPFNKNLANADPNLALKGYVVMAYSARGLGDSCGSLASRLADPSGCAAGWVHLDDARFEARDTQTLAGKLADAGLVEPQKIGVTGTSYGGGVSYLLAALKDRVELPDGRLVPWVSPQRHLKMSIAAAAPQWGWSDLSYALAPNGNTLDYLVNNPYGSRTGVEKQSWVNVLYSLGAGLGFYPPQGADPRADLTGWKGRIDAGEPYDGDSYISYILFQLQRFHSAYYLQDGIPRKQWEQPAPILAYNSWIDDLFPADEVLRYRNYVLGHWPKAEFSVLFAAGAGHARANLRGATPDIADAIPTFFDRQLKGAKGGPIGVRTYTQNCGSSPALGPFYTPTWAGQHPGEVRYQDSTPHGFDGNGGDPAVAAAVDPQAAQSTDGCVSTAASDDADSATYRLNPVQNGYTLIGSPTVVATIATGDENAQVQARLWDVGPDGQQTFVTRGTFRPALGRNQRQVFQLHPNGWYFAPGHVPKLELLGRDSPYGRASNGNFAVTVKDMDFRLPVHEQPGGEVTAPAPLVRRDGLNFGSCTNPRTGTPGPDRLGGTNAGDLLVGLGGGDLLSGRQGIDCLGGGAGPDTLRGGPAIDVLIGDVGRDRLFGGKGADAIAGNAGHDRIFGGPGPDRIFARDGRTAWSTAEQGGSVSAIDTATWKVRSRLALPGPVKAVGVAVSADGRRVYVTTSHSNGVDVVDAERNAMIATIPVGGRPWGVALSPDGKRLFTANGATGNVSIVDVDSLRAIATVAAGDGPWGVAVGR